MAILLHHKGFLTSITAVKTRGTGPRWRPTRLWHDTLPCSEEGEGIG